MLSFAAKRSPYLVVGIVGLLAIAQAILPGGSTPVDFAHKTLALIGQASPDAPTVSSPAAPEAKAPASVTPSVTNGAAFTAASKPNLSPTPGAPSAIQSGTSSANANGKARNRNTILAYYVPYDPTSWQSLQANAANIDFVAPQWVDIDACGDIGSRDDNTLIAFARGIGLGILPSLLTGSQELNHRLLGNPATAQRAIQQLVAYVVDGAYDGLDLDLENINPADRQAYTSFVQSLSAELHKNGKLFTAAIPPKSFDATTGWAGAYDYAAIAPYFDLVTIMTYEYAPNGKPGSVAPFDAVDKDFAFAASQFPPEKLLLGVAFYGYDWDSNTGQRIRSLRNPYASVLAERFGATIALDPTTKSATFAYTLQPGETAPPDEKLPALDHQIITHALPACSAALPTPTPTKIATPRPSPTGVQKHVVWIEDARAVLARLQIVAKYGVAGIGTWRLGQEDPAIWPDFQEWRSSANR